MVADGVGTVCGGEVPMTIIVCGGRDYPDRAHVFGTLDRVRAKHGAITIRHGACGLDAEEPFDAARLRGADRWAHEWAVERGMAVQPVAAFWRRFGKPAGPTRNGELLAGAAVPVAVVAFPGGSGTAGMIRIARQAGIVVWEVRQ